MQVVDTFFQAVSDAVASMAVPLGFSSDSSLSAAQNSWLEISAYFSDYQCAKPGEEQRLLADLPLVAQHFDCIIEALLTERKMVMSLLAKKESSPLNPSSSAYMQASGTSPPYNKYRTPVRDARRRSSLAADDGDSPQAAESVVSSISYAPSRTHYLPPTYFYLFGAPVVSSDNDEMEAAGTRSVTAADGESDVVTAVPFETTVGPLFLMTLCQYAKHNQPAGSQEIILRFLTRLLHEADIPVRRLSSGKRVRSLLQLSPGTSVVPLLDMIRRVGASLDPTYFTGHGGSSITTSAAWSGSTMPSSDAQRTAFVIFLCALAEKAERVPEVANFFITEAKNSEELSRTMKASRTDPAAAVMSTERRAEPSEEPKQYFVLLDLLLPYLTHDSTAPGWENRRDTCRYALGAVLSLAKCPDSWVQDLVAAEEAVANRTLAGACSTLLTLCKVPDNEDSVVGLAYLKDVLRFWAGMCLSAPVVAKALGIPEMIERDFAVTTMLPLFMSLDSRVYATACLVVGELVKDLNASAPVVTRALARALLASMVNPATGRVVPNADYYDSTMAITTEGSGSSSPGPAAGGAATEVPFFSTYLRPHLCTNPVLTEEDLINRSVLQISLTEWTATECTLLLLKALCENSPYIFMRYALLLDMNTIIDVRVNEAADASSAATGLSGAASAPPIDLQHCFSARLRAQNDTLCGTSREKLGEEVLERLLRIESNVPALCLQRRQRAIQAASVRLGSATSSSNTSSNSSNNCWYNGNVHLSPLVAALCELLGVTLRLPYRVRLIAMELAVSLCLLPDLRVLYTLMDPERGPMSQTLCGLKRRIDVELDEDEKVAYATAAAAAMVGSKPTPRTSSGSSRGSTGKQPHTSRAYLYQLFLRHWECLPAHVLHSPENIRDTRTVGRAAAQLSDGVLKLMVRHQPFLEACAAVELLRLEMDAVVGYMALSHNLMTLSIGEG